MRELLFNVAKHAQSGKASLDMKRNGRMLQIHVRDEGVGFDVASLAARQTYGMQQIRRHVALLNGALKIDSAAGQGTAISITFDLEPEALPGRESFPTFT